MRVIDKVVMKIRYMRHANSLRRVDTNVIPTVKKEIRLFAVVRNEALRIRWFVNYYSKLGIDRFFFVDNDSSDGTREILASWENVHVFITRDSFKASKCGSFWRERLLGKYGNDHWCLVADADEMFIYPGYENTSLHDLCKSMENEGSLGMKCIWVQMYSKDSIRSSKWRDGEDPLTFCSYFDRNSAEECPHPTKFGWEFNIHKAPLFFRCKNGPRLSRGHHIFHWHGQNRESQHRGAVLHFKFTSDLYERCEEILQRLQHFKSEEKYGGFYRAMVENPDMNLMHSGSVHFDNSTQLVDLGIMHVRSDMQGGDDSAVPTKFATDGPQLGTS